MVYHDYTQDEIDIHHEAILRREAAEQKAQANIARVAANAKTKQFSKFIKQLDETGNRIDKATGNFQTTAQNLSEDLGAALSTLRKKRQSKSGNA